MAGESYTHSRRGRELDARISRPDPDRPEGVVSYVRAMRGHAAIVVVLLVMTVGCAAAWLEVKEPSYTATAELLITPLPANDRAFQRLQLLRDSNGRRADQLTRAVELTAQRVGAGFSQRGVERAVEVQPQGQSNIITVSGQCN
jgi:uncharacterized protein involved in exopolysaccharide biosynthesis